jgi:hypothetical protein
MVAPTASRSSAAGRRWVILTAVFFERVAECAFWRG